MSAGHVHHLIEHFIDLFDIKSDREYQEAERLLLLKCGSTSQ